MATPNRFFTFIELKFEDLTSQINTWLQTVYNKADILFNSSSPYGQILDVQKEVFTHNILYNKMSVNQLDLETTIDRKAIWYIGRVAGHNPSRAISATGTLQFKLKGGVNVLDEFNTSNPVMVIKNKSSIKNKTNNLNYIFNLGQEQNYYNITAGSSFNVPIIQGIYETQQFTGDGNANQSFSINVQNQSIIDNFTYQVYYNGTFLTVKDHQYDMLQGEFACWTKTGFNGGLDLYFGNEDYGFIPEIGSSIAINYLVTNGSAGEVLNPVLNDWKIVDDIKTIDGNDIDVAKLFDISVSSDINFASDGEDPIVSKQIIPYVSRNFVLASPDQFIYHLLKLNMFSTVNAYNMLGDGNSLSGSLTGNDVALQIQKLKLAINNNKPNAELLTKVIDLESTFNKFRTNSNDNQIYLYLIPKITKYFTNDVNYFNIPLKTFYLSTEQQDKVLNYLKSQAILSITTEIVFINPKISKFVTFVYVTRFSNSTEDNISQQILTTISNFMTSNKRTDRIVKAELMSIIKQQIPDIDSLDIQFIVQKNEEYHINGILNSGTTTSSYNPDNVIGLDPVLGDVLLDKQEYSLIRGGWKDRYGVYYNDTPNQKGLTSVNIIFNGITPS